MLKINIESIKVKKKKNLKSKNEKKIKRKLY
jgi:hypothetical protein